MTTTKKVAYGVMTLGAIIVVIAVLNIPVINIIGIVIGCSTGFVGYKLYLQGQKGE